MPTTRQGPGGTPLVDETQGKRIYAMAKGLDESQSSTQINAVIGAIVGHQISHTSKLTVPEYEIVKTELERRKRG